MCQQCVNLRYKLNKAFAEDNANKISAYSLRRCAAMEKGGIFVCFRVAR